MTRISLHRISPHRVAQAVAAVYLLAVAAVVFWPTPVDRPAAGTLKETLLWLHDNGVPAFIDYNFVEFSANILMFFPLGILIYAALKNRITVTRFVASVVIGAVASGAIELTQGLLLTERFSSVWDVVANTLGTALGALCAWLVLRIDSSKRRSAAIVPQDQTSLLDSPFSTPN